MSAIIGVTTGSGSSSHNEPVSPLAHAHIQAILESGGAPVMIPAPLPDGGRKSIYPDVDGILFSGGGDVELPDQPFGVAVQCHRGRLLDQQHPTRLFRRFVDAAADYHERADQGWSK